MEQKFYILLLLAFCLCFSVVGILTTFDAIWGLALSCLAIICLFTVTRKFANADEIERDLLIGLITTVGQALMFFLTAALSSFIFRHRKWFETLDNVQSFLLSNTEISGIFLLSLVTFILKWCENFRILQSGKKPIPSKSLAKSLVE